MDKDKAQQRLQEWRIVEATGVWQDFVEGMKALEKVHILALRKTENEKKIYRSQGALDVISVVLNAPRNQVNEALSIVEGKQRTTGVPARVQ
jgi:hypothetical protein